MSKLNSLLSERLQNKERPSKMTDLAKRSSEGSLTSFSGVFGSVKLSDEEKESLQDLLESYGKESCDITKDLRALSNITSEIKAINNQAALLHGERIKQAQTLLKAYQEGAFTAWLLRTYGNRQTPYNLLQYFELHRALPSELQAIVESMPRQAVYTLASREGSLEDKIAILTNYQGQSKKELLLLIREAFPLKENDKRKSDEKATAIRGLFQHVETLRKRKHRFTEKDKEMIRSLLEELQQYL